MPDVALLVELVGNLVAHNAAALVEASEAHDRELSDELRRPAFVIDLWTTELVVRPRLWIRGPERCSPELGRVTARVPCFAAVVPMRSDERLWLRKPSSAGERGERAAKQRGAGCEHVTTGVPWAHFHRVHRDPRAHLQERCALGC